MRLTTQSEPKILMEVMPAGLVVSLLVLTYLVFAGGVTLIVRYNLRGTSTLVAAAAPAGTTGLGALCAAVGGLSSTSTWPSAVTGDVTSAGSATTATAGGVFVVGIDGPDPDSSSAAGCTVFSPGALSELSLDAPTPSSSSFSMVDDGEGNSRYGAVFSGQFSGMTDLSGSVSLHVSVSDGDALSSLPDPAVVDLALEACTGEPMTAAGGDSSGSDGGSGAEGEGEGEEELAWGTCEGGWQPVLFQVRYVRHSSLSTPFSFGAQLISARALSPEGFAKIGSRLRPRNFTTTWPARSPTKVRTMWGGTSIAKNISARLLT